MINVAPTGLSPKDDTKSSRITVPVAPVSIMALMETGAGAVEISLENASSAIDPTANWMDIVGPTACKSESFVVKDGI